MIQRPKDGLPAYYNSLSQSQIIMYWLACILAVHLWSVVGVLAIIERESRMFPEEDEYEDV